MRYFLNRLFAVYPRIIDQNIQMAFLFKHSFCQLWSLVNVRHIIDRLLKQEGGSK